MENRKISPAFDQKIPPGDDRLRRVCLHCDHIEYENPKIVVGSVVSFNEKILLCRRAIEPRIGFWTIPAGYLELGETPEQGAIREAQEEACAVIEIDQLLGIYSVSRISQVQLMFRAQLTDEAISAGPESQEVGLFHWNEIPWEEMAFPTAIWALRHYNEVRNRKNFIPFSKASSFQLES